VQQDNTQPSSKRIPARSQRQVMDWSLVLASQGITAEIVQDDAGWALSVNETDFDRAQQMIHLYRAENRGWKWRRPIPGSKLVFHSGSVFWVIAIFWIFWWSSSGDQPRTVGAMDNAAVSNGEWWRLFTAVTLHSDWAHLIANGTTGLVLLGLAMARHGGGIGLLAAFACGIAGNLAGWLTYESIHRGLGASGMVMGALGLLALQPFGFFKHHRIALEIIFRGIVAACLMFILLGTSPGTDVIAHFGGFACGVILGGALNFLPDAVKAGPINKLCGLLVPILVIAAWRLALKQ
jgi:rhomboid protease GluP